MTVSFFSAFFSDAISALAQNASTYVVLFFRGVSDIG